MCFIWESSFYHRPDEGAIVLVYTHVLAPTFQLGCYNTVIFESFFVVAIWF